MGVQARRATRRALARQAAAPAHRASAPDSGRGRRGRGGARSGVLHSAASGGHRRSFESASPGGTRSDRHSADPPRGEARRERNGLRDHGTVATPAGRDRALRGGRIGSGRTRAARSDDGGRYPAAGRVDPRRWRATAARRARGRGAIHAPRGSAARAGGHPGEPGGTRRRSDRGPGAIARSRRVPTRPPAQGPARSTWAQRQRQQTESGAQEAPDPW